VGASWAWVAAVDARMLKRIKPSLLLHISIPLTGLRRHDAADGTVFPVDASKIAYALFFAIIAVQGRYMT
jgi:hypothetical protein